MKLTSCMQILQQLLILFSFSIPFQEHKASLHGIRSGLSVILRYPDYEQPISTSAYNTSLRMGFKIIVNNNYDFPNRRSLSIYSTVNQEQFILVQPSETVCSSQVQQLTIEERQCVFPAERQSKFFPGYSESNCEVECQLKRMHETCGCINFAFPQIENVPVCNFTKIMCLSQNWSEFILI